MRDQLKDAKFHLEIFVAIAIGQPVKADGFRFTWTDPQPEGKAIWRANEGVFKVERDPQKAQNPFTLTMTVRDGKTCSAGPFHSVAAAKEAADRIWNYMLQAQIHHSQVIGGGFLGVVSRVLFPSLQDSGVGGREESRPNKPMNQNESSTDVVCNQISTKDIVVFCDESGAKGYADRSESIEGETGVFAGFVVPRSDLPALQNDLRPVVDQLSPQPGKLHITDLAPTDQESLRQDIFNVLSS
jgi:hypothetical protein